MEMHSTPAEYIGSFMARNRSLNIGSRIPRPSGSSPVGKRAPWSAPLSKRARGGQINERLPFVPPEDWYEPEEKGAGYRLIVQPPGEGYRHVLTPDEVRDRIDYINRNPVKEGLPIQKWSFAEQFPV